MLGGKSIPNIDVSSFTYSNEFGFSISGDFLDLAGLTVAPTGDINHDGFPDIILGAPGMNNFAGGAYIVYGGKTAMNIDLSNLNNDFGFKIFGNVRSQYVGMSVSCVSDNSGNSLLVLGTYNGYVYIDPSYTGIYTWLTSSTMPTSTTNHPTGVPTFSPSARPTAFPTPIPSYYPSFIPTILPTKSPVMPPTFVQNEPLILGVAIPATLGFLPIFFSRQICFWVLDNWDSVSSPNRECMKILIYTGCKRVFLKDFIDSKEALKVSKQISDEKATNHAILDGGQHRSIELGIVQKTQAKLQQSESLENMKKDDNEIVINPIIDSDDETDFEGQEISQTRNFPINQIGKSITHTFNIPVIVFDHPMINDVYYRKKPASELYNLFIKSNRQSMEINTATAMPNNQLSTTNQQSIVRASTANDDSHHRASPKDGMKYYIDRNTQMNLVAHHLQSIVEHLPTQLYLFQYYIYPAVFQQSDLLPEDSLLDTWTMWVLTVMNNKVSLFLLHAAVNLLSFYYPLSTTYTPTMNVVPLGILKSIKFGVNLYGFSWLERLRQSKIQALMTKTSNYYNNSNSISNSSSVQYTNALPWNFCLSTSFVYIGPTVLFCSMSSDLSHGQMTNCWNENQLWSKVNLLKIK
jgi:hypothetical protein